MNDFTTLTKAVVTAEDIMKEYSASTERVIKSKSIGVLGQISDYLYKVLNECDFTKLQIQCNTQPGYYKPDTSCGYCGITTANYLVNGKNYYGLLYVYSGNNHLKVYFNKQGIEITGNDGKETIIVLCYYWKKLKADLDIAIKKSLEKRLDDVKKEADIAKSRTALIDNFEL